MLLMNQDFLCVKNCIAHNIGHNKCDDNCECHCHSKTRSPEMYQVVIDEAFGIGTYKVSSKQYENEDEEPTNEITIWVKYSHNYQNYIKGIQLDLDISQMNRIEKLLKPFRLDKIQFISALDSRLAGYNLLFKFETSIEYNVPTGD